MESTGGPPAVAPAGGLVELQRRVLDSVARSVDGASGEVTPVGPARCDARQAQCVADGLRVLLASLPTVTGHGAGAVTTVVGGEADAVGPADVAALLAQAGEVLDRVAEAARRAGIAFAVVGQEVAADIADSLMTVALALRMLVELGRRALARA